MDDSFIWLEELLKVYFKDSSKQTKPLSPDKAANGLSSINQCEIL